MSSENMTAKPGPRRWLGNPLVATAVVLAARGVRLDGSRDVRAASKEDTARKPHGGAQAGDSQT